jgi:hypothetical protein
MSEIITLPPRGGDGGGLTIVTDALAPYQSAFAVARQCADLRTTLPAKVADLGTAKIVRAKLLPCVEEIYFASRALADMVSDNPRQRINAQDAVEMLGFLFGVLRRNDKGADTASLLTACTEMFNEDAALAAVLGVKLLPRHPAILPLAIRKIISTAIFPPSPSEVRAAMHQVRDKILLLRSEVTPVLALARAAERIAFQQDRAAWAAPYASGAVPSAVAGYLVTDSDDEMSAAVDHLFADESDNA